jgi:hypothetical protein
MKAKEKKKRSEPPTKVKEHKIEIGTAYIVSKKKG